MSRVGHPIASRPDGAPLVRVPVAFPPTAVLRVPPELEGFRRLAYNLYWSWHPQARALFAPDQRRRLGADPQPDPGPSGMVDWPRLLDNPDFMVEAQRAIADFDRYMANGADHWFHRRHAERAQGPDRLLLRRVRPPRIARASTRAASASSPATT